MVFVVGICAFYVSWKELPSFEDARFDAAAIVIQNPKFGEQLLVTGGFDGGSLDLVDLLNLRPNGVNAAPPKWRSLARMHHGCSQHGIAHFRDKVIIAGLEAVELLSLPQSADDLGQWTELKMVSENPTGAVNLAVWQGRLFAFSRSILLAIRCRFMCVCLISFV